MRTEGAGSGVKGEGRAVPLVVVVAAAVCLMGGFLGPAALAIPVSTTDLWDVSQGSAVTANSPVLGPPYYSTGYHSDIRDMFGGAFAPIGATVTMFQDYQPTGTLHWVEWETLAPITLRSFNLLADHDGPPRDATARGFSRFTLFAYNPATSSFDNMLFEVFPTNPYGDTVAPPYSMILTNPGKNRLELSANVVPTAAQRFRAELVQFGYWSGNASGPRVLELDGYNTFLPGIDEPPSGEPIIPEPCTLALLSVGGLALLSRRRRRETR